LQEPFREFLISLALGDGKVNSIFNKIGVGESFGYEILDELLKSGIVNIVHSREKPIKAYPKQLIKKELKSYLIQDKIFFTKPFYRFWFSFVEPNRDSSGNIDTQKVLSSFRKNGYRLASLVFEQLSKELLIEHFKKSGINFKKCNSYWDRFSEFDIYCKSESISVIGECKYTNRPIIKAELSKLESKIVQSSLSANYIALFSKSGFSHELLKIKDNNLLLFELKDFELLFYCSTNE